MIFNSLKAVLLDADFSERCKEYLSKLACRWARVSAAGRLCWILLAFTT